MRILIISDVSSYMRGGVPVETKELLNGLVLRGHEVAFGANAPLCGEQVRHYAFSINGSNQATQLKQILAHFKPELVHVMAMGSGGFTAIAPLLRNQQWVYTCHTLPPFERKLACCHNHDKLHYALRALRFAANTLAWKWLLRKANIPCIIAHSRYVQNIVENYGYQTGKSRLIPLGFNRGESATHAAAFRTLSSSPKILTVGGIAHTKGQHDAILAMANLKHDFPNFTYQLIGEVRDDSYLQFLNKLIDQKGLSKHIKITPNLDETSKQSALQQADFYLQPSHEEGFCLSYIEAAGIVPRLIGTDTGAIALISADDLGMQVVSPKSPTEIADSIRKLAATTLPEDLLITRNLRLEKQFSWESYLDQHEQLYKELKLKSSM